VPAEAERRGIRYVRTQRLSGGRYRRIYVVEEPGPHGGHTVAGEPQQRKAQGSKTYDKPRVTMKPRPLKMGWRKGKKADAT
jgi:hypothetical protein